MFENYKKEVIEYYKKKKNNDDLSPNLIDPSPARVRNECLKVYEENSTDNDDPILRLFFNRLPNEINYSASITRVDIDKFKPLINLIDNPQINSDRKNIKLLAWLLGYKNQSSITTGTLKNGRLFLSSKKRSLVIGISIIFAAIVATLAGLKANVEQCMYWDGNKYQIIACDKYIPNVTKVAKDEIKLKYLQKITTPDTLTQKDIGKVHYKKTGIANIEFYTSAGNYPPDEKKKLKPMTKYMFDKYISPLKLKGKKKP